MKVITKGAVMPMLMRLWFPPKRILCRCSRIYTKCVQQMPTEPICITLGVGGKVLNIHTCVRGCTQVALILLLFVVFLYSLQRESFSCYCNMYRIRNKKTDKILSPYSLLKPLKFLKFSQLNEIK